MHLKRRFVVGDLQGHLKPLLKLLDHVQFNSKKDELWVCGDLINRGPDSLAVLRTLKEMNNVKIVLGNHDLHFLAIAQGYFPAKNKDTFDSLLAAPDVDSLVNWLLEQPLVHFEDGLFMSHAGLPHIWTEDQALALSNEMKKVLKKPQKRAEFFSQMYGDEPDNWNDALQGLDRWRCITNYFTRMRYIAKNGRLEFASKEGIGTDPVGFFPWYSLRKTSSTTIVFGHWAALMGKTKRQDILGLDTGYVWGNQLTIYNEQKNELLSLDAHSQIITRKKLKSPSNG